MTKEKETFDSITPKIIIGQLYKSANTMRIVSLKTNSYSIRSASREYANLILPLVDSLAEIHFGVSKKKELDEIPGARYIDPTMHINDISYYLEGNSKLFKTQQELSVINDILSCISHTKYLLSLE